MAAAGSGGGGGGARFPSASGPRRGAHVATATATATASATATAGSPAPHDTDGGGGKWEPLLPGRAAAARAVGQVAAALHAVNLFVRPVIVADAEVAARGRVKTRIFAVAFVVLVATLLIMNLVQLQTNQVTLLWPSAAEYAGAAAHAPVCQCSNTGTVVGSVATMNLPASHNFSLNACATLASLYTPCGKPLPLPNNPDMGPCVQTDAGALLWVIYLQPLAIQSYSFSNHFSEYTAIINSYPVGPVLLSASALTAFVEGVVLEQMRMFWLIANQILEGNIATATLSMPPSYELTAGARYTSPPGCTCAGSVYNPSPAAQANHQCFFQPAFDTRPTSNATARWTCNAPVAVVLFPIQLLTLPSTYEVLALSPPYDNYTQFAGAAQYANQDPANATNFNAYIFDSMSSFFPLDAAGVPIPASLSPGLLTIDYDAHFATCAPSSCTYVYTTRPSAVAAITAVLGLISGAQTVLMLLVDRGVDFYYTRRPAAALTLTNGEAHKVDGDDDGDGVTGAAPHAPPGTA